MASAVDYLESLRAGGRYHFTTNDAVEALGGSLARVRAELRRLKADGEVVDPHRSFHIIVPPEQRECGCLPAVQLVPPLMRHLREFYYVALLSASEMYGCALKSDVRRHEHPFQMMAKVTRKPIDCGDVRLQFLARKDLERTPLLEASTPFGALRVASPEATALELVGYAHQCGGLENIATVLAGMVDAVDPRKLADIAPLAPIAWTQRLGYLLDVTNNRGLANVLAPIVKELARDFAPLVRARPKAGVTRLARWKLAVNASL
jgi:AbiEi antitoxin C-terminal domain